MEFFVSNIQPYISTYIIRFLIKIYIIVSSFLSSNKQIVKQVIDNINYSRSDKVTILTEKANQQHYEIPTEFFILHLGPKLKYSSCEWNYKTIEENEIMTLKSYQKYATLENLCDNSNVLEMGSGWGSLSLFNAETYPKLNFISFSNSESQVDYINKIAEKKGLTNLNAHVEDYQDFCSNHSKLEGKKFDRIFAIETIEHSRNIECLFKYISHRLNDNGKVFIQSLVHQHKSYMVDNTNWMGRNFFSGGHMLAMQSYLHYNKHLIVTSMTPRNGKEYSKTLEVWLNKLEKSKDIILKLYGHTHYEKFRMFYMQSIEAFAAKDGSLYMTCYYELEKR